MKDKLSCDLFKAKIGIITSRLFYVLFCFIYLPTSVSAQAPSNIQVIKDFESKYVQARDIYIRLPLNYDKNQNYPMLYMHDGQMLWSYFDTWNGQSWEIDKKINALVSEEKIADLIVVGIQSISERRYANYFPEKPFLQLPAAVRNNLLKQASHPDIGINSDAYLKFLVYELKPFIDSHFATKPTVEHTFISGSSMGGLISMYALFEYPEIFGGAACLSTHWIGGYEQNEVVPNAFYNYMEARLGLLTDKKLYFDYGNQTLDAMYASAQKQMDALFESNAALKSQFLSKFYPGAAHQESDWHARFDMPLKFLLSQN